MNRVKNHQGFLLAPLLFFLFIMELLVLNLFGYAQHQLHINENYMARTQQFKAAEAGLTIAEGELPALAQHGPNQFTIRYAGYVVTYEAQRLANNFCITGQRVYNYRVTARVGQTMRNSVVLQTSYAKRSDERCVGNEVGLQQEGRSSWRELN